MRTFLTAALLALGCAHQPIERVAHQDSTLAYRSIELDGAFDIDVEVGSSASVELSGDDKAVERTDVVVDGEQLAISMKRRRPWDGSVTIRITTPVLESLRLDGAADLTLSVEQAEPLRVELNGAGDVRARGRVTSFALQLNGAGAVDARQLVAERVTVELSGTGDAKVHATQELTAELHGVGSIRYAGNPERVVENVGGVGTVAPLE